MKLTCLGGQVGELQNGQSSPSCFLLDLCHTRVLLECPIDLSALLRFLPSTLPSDMCQQGVESVTRQRKTAGFSPAEKYDDQQELPNPEPASKRPRLSTEASIPVQTVPQEASHLLKEFGGRYFLDSEPWYKTPDFTLFDVASLNAVIISNPVAMLGLPLLFRNPDFTAKVYATDATAKLGQLMMEELVALHREYVQAFGRRSINSSVPPWLLPQFSTSLQQHLGERMAGLHDAGEQWHVLYSAGDVKDCMARVHRLRYGEESVLDGYIRITPSSAGYGLGSSNWVLKGSNRSLSYISTTVAKANYAMPSNIPALDGSQVLLFSHGIAPSEHFQDKPYESGGKGPVALGNVSVDDSKAPDILANEARQAIEAASAPRQSSHRTSPSATPSVTAGPMNSVAGGNAGLVAHKVPSHRMFQVTSEKAGKAANEENEGVGPSASGIVDERVRWICKSAVEAVRRGGSVLIPVGFYGMFLELIEELARHFRSVGLVQVPLFYVSPVAEVLLAYANTVPEWLCPARQEKLYAGESLFGFFDALQENQLQHSPSLLSTIFMRSWQEPCVVFACHWSLRVGPATHLLLHWRNNPLCLLVLTEPNTDQQLVLAPFMPVAMQVLHVPLFESLRSQDVVAFIRKLKPQLTLIPKSFPLSEETESSAKSKLGPLWYYDKLTTLKVPRFKNQDDLKVELSADLALQIQLKQVKAGKVAAARFRGELRLKDGHWSLDTASPSTASSDIPFGAVPKYQIRWGSISLHSLLTSLRERGMYDFALEEAGQNIENENTNSSKTVVIDIKSPSHAKIELSPRTIHIHANEPSLRRTIVEVVNDNLNVL